MEYNNLLVVVVAYDRSSCSTGHGEAENRNYSYRAVVSHHCIAVATR